MEPPPYSLEFLICCSNSRRFYLYLQWKVFDLLNKTRYILWDGCTAGDLRLTSNGRHLGFYQELEIRIKPREMVIFFVLDMKNNT